MAGAAAPHVDDGQAPVLQQRLREGSAVGIGRSGRLQVSTTVADFPLVPGQMYYSGAFWSATDRDSKCSVWAVSQLRHRRIHWTRS